MTRKAKKIVVKVTMQACPICEAPENEITAKDLHELQGCEECQHCGYLLLPSNRAGQFILNQYPETIKYVEWARAEYRRPVVMTVFSL